VDTNGASSAMIDPTHQNGVRGRSALAKPCGQTAADDLKTMEYAFDASVGWSGH